MRYALSCALKSPITVHFHALADVKAGKGSVGFDGAIDPLIKGLNRIYSGQANIRFSRGRFKVTDTINGRKIDFDRPIVVNPRIRNPNCTDPARQLFTLGAFLPQAINPVKEINVFITPGLVDLPNAAGTSSIFDEKLCWGKSSSMKSPQVSSRIIGHEIGHLLRLTHLDGVGGTLMFPALNGAGDVIPAETLETIRIP